MPSDLSSLASRRGRPRKFTVPSRPITLTLPEHVIEALAAVDPDLSRAVVRLTQPELAKHAHPPAELATFGRHAVIVVNPSRTLEERTGISLIHLPDGRALISFEQPQTIADVELLISDALDEHRLSAEDESVFEAIADILRSARRSGNLTLLQRSIIVLETPRGRRKRAASRIRRGTRRRVNGGRT
jgi:hypothetical protein